MVEQSRADSPPLMSGRHCYGQYFRTKNIKHGKAHWMSIFDIRNGNYIRIYKPLGYDLTIVTEYGKDFT